METEYYQEKMEFKKNLKVFQNIVAFLKISSTDFTFFVFICRATRICSRSLFISCAIIVVLTTRIFLKFGFGKRVAFKIWGYST